jgi:hypothetical protein
MMHPAYIEKLYNQKLISEEEYAALKEQQEQPVSLFTDLHALLYAGILLLATGLGVLLYKNIDGISHATVVAIIALLCIGCFIYCFKKLPGFLPVKQIVVHPLADYILLLGCLLLLTLTGYLQYQYNLFDNHWGLATFIPMVLLFFFAYYFDHPGVLSLAITNLAAWLGITVTPLNILKSNNFSDPHLFYSGIALSTGLFAVAYISGKKKLKAHFGFTYQSFGIHLLFICLLAGMFYYERFYFIWFLFIAGLTATMWFYAIRKRSFYFFVTTVLYCYVAVCYVVYRLLYISDMFETFYLYAIWIICSGIGLIYLLIRYNKIIKHGTTV